MRIPSRECDLCSFGLGFDGIEGTSPISAPLTCLLLEARSEQWVYVQFFQAN